MHCTPKNQTDSIKSFFDKIGRTNKQLTEKVNDNIKITLNWFIFDVQPSPRAAVKTGEKLTHTS